MPLSQVDVTVSGIYAVQNVTQIIGPGHLTQVSVIMTSAASLGPVAFAQVGLGQTAGPQNQISLLLTSGYLSSRNGIEWSGSIEMEPEMFLLLQVTSDRTAVLRLSWYSEI
jgi:hypothetical protein